MLQEEFIAALSGSLDVANYEIVALDIEISPRFRWIDVAQIENRFDLSYRVLSRLESPDALFVDSVRYAGIVIMPPFSRDDVLIETYLGIRADDSRQMSYLPQFGAIKRKVKRYLVHEILHHSPRSPVPTKHPSKASDGAHNWIQRGGRIQQTLSDITSYAIAEKSS